ncbi:oligosaccharide flippase family protein [candidate division WOR-3 bacterium]|uniref:Oligosaccharide flippase family protein n=1 Tax=candidate division WOR-3 bacterium TaxID=2052148 RepID=A0A9D5K941_UNCW3|nr:oligosaccharide flippase family protein [candidate division WOR-3 bacterium]MBD3364370.1 oligosaccharide flippase family protein [candidate division WOR-3 bacterium]
MKLKDLKSLSKDTIIYGVGSATRQIVLVLMAPLFAAYLTVDRFGSRAMLTALYGFLQIIILLAINQAVIADYYKVKTEKERRSIVSTAFVFSFLTSLIVGGLVFTFASFLPEVMSFLGIPISNGIMGLEIPEAIPILKLFSVYTVFTPPTFIILAMLQSRKRPLPYTIFSVTQGVVRVGLMVLFLVVLKRELRGVFEADALLAVGTFPVLIIFVMLYSKGIKFSKKHLKSMLQYSAPLLLTAAFFWGKEMLDRFLILIYLTEAHVGIFAFARNFPKVVSFLLVTPLNWAWIPYAFSIKDKPEMPGTLSRVLTYFLLISGWLLIILTGSATELLQIIAKQWQYWLGAPYVPLLIFSIILFAANRIISTPFHLKRKTSYITITSSISTVLVAAINIVLLPFIKLYASAIAPVIGYGTAMVVSIILVRKYLKIPYEMKRIILISVFSIFISIVLYFWHPFFPSVRVSCVNVTAAYFYWHRLSPLFSFLVKCGVGTIAYVVLLLCAGFLLPGERNLIKTKLSRTKQ